MVTLLIKYVPNTTSIHQSDICDLFSQGLGHHLYMWRSVQCLFFKSNLISKCLSRSLRHHLYMGEMVQSSAPFIYGDPGVSSVCSLNQTWYLSAWYLITKLTIYSTIIVTSQKPDTWTLITHKRRLISLKATVIPYKTYQSWKKADKVR